jgi:hypothetical protein
MVGGGGGRTYVRQEDSYAASFSNCVVADNQAPAKLAISYTNVFTFLIN